MQGNPFKWLCLVCSALVFQVNADLKKPSAVNSIFDMGQTSFVEVGTKEDIPEGIITALIQDEQGFVWMGTQNGLVRYDGYRFLRFTHDPENKSTIAANFIQSLNTNNNGQLWVGTASNGLSLFDMSTQKVVAHWNVNKGLSDNTVRAIATDNRNNAFIATNNGLQVISNNQQLIKVSRVLGCEVSLQKFSLRTVLIDSNGFLWIGSRFGLCRVDVDNILSAEANQTATEGIVEGEEFTAFNNEVVFRLFEDTQQNIWVGTTRKGAFKIVNNTFESVPVSRIDASDNDKGDWVFGMIQPEPDKIWIANYGRGVSVVDIESAKEIKHFQNDLVDTKSLTSNNVSGLLFDDSGLIWVATWGEGLNLYNPQNTGVRTLGFSPKAEFSLNEPSTTAILELQNGQIWLGNTSNGITIVDPNNSSIEPFSSYYEVAESFSETDIIDFTQSANGTVWIATNENGIFGFDPKSEELIHFNEDNGLARNQVFSIYIDLNENIWIATGGGVVLLDTQTNSIRQIDELAGQSPFDSTYIHAMVITEEKYLWLATIKGLYVYNILTSSLLEISESAKTSNNIQNYSINSLLINNSGQLVFATSVGVYKLLSFDGKFAHFEAFNDILSKAKAPTTNLLQDSQGVYWYINEKIDLANKNFELLDKFDGWDIGTIWTGAHEHLDDGTLLFGGSDGLMMVRPELWQDWQYNPPIVVTELEIDNIPQAISKVVTLPKNSKSVSLEFSALDFTAPDKINYVYRLVGFNDNWIEASADNRRATYTNLPAGNYILEVKATNRKGKWSSHILSMPIDKLPRYYETLLFKVLSVLVLSSIIYGLLLWRTQALRLKQRRLHLLVKERTADLLEKNKQLEQASICDQLTGANNRYFFNKMITAELQQTSESQNAKELRFGLILLDVDHFKQINDKFGHSAGDEILCQITDIIKQTCREQDWVIRWGGEEFLVVCRDMNFNELSAMANRLCKAIEQFNFKILNYTNISSSCSIGYCNYPLMPEQGLRFSMEQTISVADGALYCSKSNGRNRCTGVNQITRDLTEAEVESIVSNPQQALTQGILKNECVS